MVSDKVFEEAIAGLEAMYNKKLDSFTLNLYRTIINKNFNDNNFKDAVVKLLETRVYPTFPKPAEFLEVIKPSDEQIESEIVIEKAKILEGIRRYGKNRSVCFDNFIVNKIINDSFGSWYSMCNQNLESLENYLKFEFPKYYRQLKSQDRISMIPTHLKGLDEVRNNQIGNIHYIGDKTKAERWVKKYNKKVLLEKEQIKKIENKKSW